jgi:SecD/SecF fusion protein
MFVAIIVILLLIGILVSVLYRIPGALFFANLYSTVGFTLFFLTIAGKIISLGLLLGIVGGIIIAVASFFAIMQRMKKHTSKNDFVINAVKKGAVKGL